VLIEMKQLTFDPEVREKEVAAVPVDHISREAIVPRKPVAHASLARDTPAARTILYSFPRRRTADSRRHRPELRFQQPYPAVELIPLCPKLLQLPLYRLPPAAAAAAAHPSALARMQSDFYGIGWIRLEVKLNSTLIHSTHMD